MAVTLPLGLMVTTPTLASLVPVDVRRVPLTLPVLVGRLPAMSFMSGVGVSVDEHVDAVHNFSSRSDGAVAGGFLVDAQVAQADDVIAAVRLQGVHLRLCAVEHGLVAGQEWSRP